MPNQPTTYLLFCGVDIAADTFTAACLKPAKSEQTEPGKVLAFKQTSTDFKRFQKWLLAQHNIPSEILVVLEATGNYWVSLAVWLNENGLGVSVINPSQARDYARFLLIKPKNDQIDAQVLTRLAYSHQPKPWNPPPQIYHELYQRLTHRDNLIDLRVQVSNQLQALSVHPKAIKSVITQKENLLAILQAQIEDIEQEIEALLTEKEDSWAKTIQLLQTIKGIGVLTACWIVTLSLNFSLCATSESLVQYAGLAPQERRSGKSVRKHALIGHGGNSRLRKALYMASLSASRFNPAIKEYVVRLKKNNRFHKEWRCAAGRKLLQIAYAVARSGHPFDPEYHVKVQEQKQQNQEKQNKKVS